MLVDDICSKRLWISALLLEHSTYPRSHHGEGSILNYFPLESDVLLTEARTGYCMILSCTVGRCTVLVYTCTVVAHVLNSPSTVMYHPCAYWTRIWWRGVYRWVRDSKYVTCQPVKISINDTPVRSMILLWYRDCKEKDGALDSNCPRPITS